MADAGPMGPSYARLVIALAITDESQPDAVEELQNELGRHLKTVELHPLNNAQMHELGAKICRLYQTAYEMPGNDTELADKLVSDALAVLQNDIEQCNPRKFIRLLLEKLDVTYITKNG